VVFPDDQPVQAILQRPDIGKTMLTEWFTANARYPEARELTYGDFPMRWVWNKGQKRWTPRKRGDTIGRMYFVPPRAGEKYYLRMLLNIVPGATSFQHLRTVDNIVYHTFRDACNALGLLQDDREWDDCLEEAGAIRSGGQLRRLFATILLFCEPTCPERLWEKHRVTLTDNILACARREADDPALEMGEEELQNRALYHLQSILQHHSKDLSDFPHMPLPTGSLLYPYNNRRIREEQ